MWNGKNGKLSSIFGCTEDPISYVNQHHKLNNILPICIISVICGTKTWKQMVEFAKSKQEFLKQFLELPNGIPSEDTIK